MSKLKSFKLIASITLMLGLSACGGGSITSANIVLTPSNSFVQIKGNWLSACISTNARSSERVMLSFSENADNSNNNAYQYKEASAVYDSPDCTGKSSVVAFSGTVSLRGEHVTSICTAVKTDVDLSSMIVDGIEFDGEVAQNFLDDVKITDPAHDIACQYRDQLFIGQVTDANNAHSASTRPTSLNVMVAFDPYRSPSFKHARIENQSELVYFHDDFKELIRDES